MWLRQSERESNTWAALWCGAGSPRLLVSHAWKWKRKMFFQRYSCSSECLTNRVPFWSLTEMFSFPCVLLTQSVVQGCFNGLFCRYGWGWGISGSREDMTNAESGILFFILLPQKKALFTNKIPILLCAHIVLFSVKYRNTSHRNLT